MNTLADNLRDFRSDAQMTVEGLSTASGVCVQTITDIESGRIRRPHARTVGRLAQALGVRAADLRNGSAAGHRNESERPFSRPHENGAAATGEARP